MTIFRCFQHFLFRNQYSLLLLFPLFPSAPFAVWVSVWVKPENLAQKLRRSNQRLRKNTCAEVSQRTDYSVARRITKSRYSSNEISPASIWRHHSMVCASGCCPSTSSDQVDWRMIHSISSGLIATSRQINSKTSITRSAAEYKLLSRCRCPFGRWLFLCRRKNIFKTGCSKHNFLSD